MKPAPGPHETAEIVDTLVDGRGVAKASGKTVFVRGAIQGETVEYVRRKKRRNFDEAELIEILQRAPERVEPLCEVFGVCGGCSGSNLVHDVKGSGLGLSIVRHIVRAHDGEITLQSEPGRGSTFAIRLPVNAPVPEVETHVETTVGSAHQVEKT